jgi:hypothetical protein
VGVGVLSTLIVLTTLLGGRLGASRRELLMVVRRGIRSSAVRIVIFRTGIESAGKIFISNATTMTRRKI